MAKTAQEQEQDFLDEEVEIDELPDIQRAELGELLGASGVQPGSITKDQLDEIEAVSTRSSFDNVYRAIARRSEAMAKATDECPDLAKILLKVTMGFMAFCREHRVEPKDVQVESHGILTPAGQIIINLYDR